MLYMSFTNKLLAIWALWGILQAPLPEVADKSPKSEVLIISAIQGIRSQFIPLKNLIKFNPSIFQVKETRNLWLEKTLKDLGID